MKNVPTTSEEIKDYLTSWLEDNLITSGWLLKTLNIDIELNEALEPAELLVIGDYLIESEGTGNQDEVAWLEVQLLNAFIETLDFTYLNTQLESLAKETNLFADVQVLSNNENATITFYLNRY